MKKFLFLVLALGFTVSSFAQYRVSMKNRAKLIAPMIDLRNIDLPTVVGLQPANDYVSNKSVLDDPITAVTKYDMQTNAAAQQRCYLYPDGTIGTACTWSTQNSSWSDRGTGYNYFDGTSWGPQPTARVESIRVGWGDYHPFGANGEMIIAHELTGPLVINTRTTKGTGTWTQTLMPTLPSNITGMSWPRVVTNGPNHTNIHIIALTLPTGNGGQTYNGMNGALLYCHSLDGGSTWSDWTQLPGMTTSEYFNFGGDEYSFAEPHGDTLAFTFGGNYMDQVLMKSTDNGTTWTKTVIYHSPYNLGGSTPHFVYCPDETSAVALDNSGTAHVVFGLFHDSGTMSSTGSLSGQYNMFSHGMVYWNEHMAQLDQSMDPDTLIKHHQLCADIQDTNVFYLTAAELAIWQKSLTTIPQLVIDKNNKVFLSWTAQTTLMDPNTYAMRHIFGRDGVISGDSIMWHSDTLVDLTGDWVQYNFSECTYPSASPTSDDAYVYILFQADSYAGCYVASTSYTGTWQGQASPDANSLTLIKWAKRIWAGVNEQHEKPTFSVGQNFPNPVNGLTNVNVYLQNQGNLSLKVTNLTGQTLMNMEKSSVLPGVSQFVIDASQLTAGVYFYTVKQGDKSITKKMVVE